MIRYNWEVGNMKYQYQDVNSLFKKMVIDTKEFWYTMDKIDKLLHDPEFEETLKTFSMDKVEELDRLFRIHNEYMIKLREMI